MAQQILRGFRALNIKDLTDLSKAAVDMEQVTEIGHDGGQEILGRRYGDSDVDNIKIRQNFTGNITIKGDIIHYVSPSYAAGSRTDPLFEIDHYYLIRFLANSATSGVAKMQYFRWIGQLTDLPKISLTPGAVNDLEVTLAIALYHGTTSVSSDTEKPYQAVADADPGPASADPATDYWPLFQAEVANTTKTLAAAEALIGASIVNPM
ncbi:MAG: hypothetical protein HUU50_02595 [Candidatus Brocadiae bacterium]|nr:hypothetical protein [Candidatus Brocadiia bacterium]